MGFIKDAKQRKEIEQRIELDNAKNSLQTMFDELTGELQAAKANEQDLEQKVMDALDAGDEEEAAMLCYELGATKTQREIYSMVRMKVNEQLVDLKMGATTMKLSATMKNVQGLVKITPSMIQNMSLGNTTGVTPYLKQMVGSMKANTKNFDTMRLLNEMKEQHTKMRMPNTQQTVTTPNSTVKTGN